MRRHQITISTRPTDRGDRTQAMGVGDGRMRYSTAADRQHAIRDAAVKVADCGDCDGDTVVLADGVRVGTLAELFPDFV